MADKNQLIIRAKENGRKIFEVVPDEILLSPAGFIFLGDHTHYTESLLLGCALDVYTAVILKKRNDNKIILSIDNGPVTEISKDSIPEHVNHFQTNLLYEILKVFSEENKLPSGFDCYIEHDVPQCVGLGYYTSIIMGFIYSLNKELNLRLTNEEMVEFGFRAWQVEIGKIANKATLQCSLLAKENNYIFSDLRKPSPEHLPFNNPDCSFIIFDTGEEIINPRDICNERIEECEVGVKGLRLYIWGIKNLRDIKRDFLEKHVNMIPRRVYNRCLYNVNERIRVELSKESLLENNHDEFCARIFDSHYDLSNLYEISTPKLDELVETARSSGKIKGAKMISCSAFRSLYSLVEKNKLDEATKIIRDSFAEKYSLEIKTNRMEMCGGIISDN